jgi:hypothetical protein
LFEPLGKQREGEMVGDEPQELQQHLHHFLEQLQITLNDKSNSPTPNESLQRSMAKLQQLNNSRPPSGLDF